MALITVAFAFFGPTITVHADTANLQPIELHRPEGLTISPGQRWVFRFDDKGAPQPLEHAPVSGPVDVAVPAPDPTKETLQYGVGPHPPSTPSGRIAATLWSSAAGGTQLKIENGFDRPIVYDAVLVRQRNGRTVYQPTTICPVLPRKLSYETWPYPVDGVIVANFRAASAEQMACTGSAGLIVRAAAPPPTRPTNTCFGGDAIRADPPLSVKLTVDPNGAVQHEAVVWTLRDPATKGLPPFALLEFPVAGGRVSDRPEFISILEVTSLDPPPPTPTATIVLKADGTEVTRRPWRLYAEKVRSVSGLPSGAHPVVLVGVVPFSPELPDGGPDSGLSAFYDAMGKHAVRTLRIELVGRLGRIINSASFDIADPPIHDMAAISPLLAEAEAKAAQPSHCANPPTPAR